MTKDDIKEAFDQKRAEAKREYNKVLWALDDEEKSMLKVIDQVRAEGIVKLNDADVQQWKNHHKFDMYKVLADRCKVWGRPYIKCAQINWRRIGVTVNDSGNGRSLVSGLLLTAEPMLPVTGFNRRTGKDTVKEPDIWKNEGISFSDAPVRSWVTARTVNILFEGEKGERQFNEWHEFCTTNRMQRLYLGL